MADPTRKHDLEELHKLRKSARNQMERNRYDSTIGKIMTESRATGSTRQKLVQAVRNNDIRAIKRFNHELTVIKQNETYGKY
jgi:RNA polymerase-binding transcription factor DksA